MFDSEKGKDESGNWMFGVLFDQLDELAEDSD